MSHDAATRPPRPWYRRLFQISVRNLLTLSIGTAAVFGAARHGGLAVGIVCVTTGIVWGLFHPNSARGLGTLRGRVFNASLGGALGGTLFVAAIVLLLWWSTGELWTPRAIGAHLLRWAGGGGLAGGCLGLVFDAVRPRSRYTRCSRCGSIVTTPGPREPLCSSCQDKDLADSLPPELWAEIDPQILANHKLPAMKRLSEVLEGGLKSALDVYVARYDFLRETSPTEFTQTHDEYWDGFYS